MPQLKMIFNAVENTIPELTIADGYSLRTVQDSELEQYNELRKSVGFGEWDVEYLQKYRTKVLNDGIFVIVENSSGKFCAAASAETTDMPEFPQLGVLGWVMCHPDHRGHHLGKSVSICAMHKLYQHKYRVFSLLTDDFRVPAVKTYLNLKWQPWLYLEDMQERWQALAEKLKMSWDDLKILPKKVDFTPMQS